MNRLFKSLLLLELINFQKNSYKSTARNGGAFLRPQTAYLRPIIFYGIYIPFFIYILYNTFKGKFMAVCEFKIRDNQDYIELGNLLKVCDIIDTGGFAKIFLKNNEVYINGELDNRRGRKLYRGDVVKVNRDEIHIK